MASSSDRSVETLPTTLGDVVVTGGSGAIGSRLVRRVLEMQPKSVTVIDDLSSGYEWLLPVDDRIRFIRRDVVDILDFDLSLERPLVFHLAAFFANQNSVDHPSDDLHTNGLGTLNVLRWAADMEAQRVVYASAGCSIAGHGIDAPIREDMPVSLHLDTPYQITKALGEFYCNYYVSRVSSVRCRFFNSYGPGEVPGPYRNAIPNFIWRALHDVPLIITGTGAETRDFIYVDDLVDGLVRSALTPDAHGEAVNLGTGVQTRIDELVRTIVALCDSRSEIQFAPRRAWDHSLRRQADTAKAGHLLGHAPRIGLSEGLKETIDWFREHRDKLEGMLTPTADITNQLTAAQ
jgi:UDP-glucose 4-epimerase